MKKIRDFFSLIIKNISPYLCTVIFGYVFLTDDVVDECNKM